jgi:hypothetical protein
MADWTTVAVAGISAGAGLFGGWLGFLGAKLQARAGLQQAELQARVAVEQADAETERLRQQLAEPHLADRKETYHRFLNHERALVGMFGSREPITDEAWREWNVAFSDLYNDLVLFGTDEVRDQAENFRIRLAAFTGLVQSRPDAQEDFNSAIRKRYKGFEGEVWQLRQSLAAAMRNDVAPERRLGRDRVD